LCGSNEIKVGNKCYLDNDRNNIKDIFLSNQYSFYRGGSSYPAGWGGILSSYHINVGNYTFTFYAPVSGNYTFRAQVDNQYNLSLNNTTILSGANWQSIQSTSRYLAQGTHTIRFNTWNHSGPQGAALVIYGTDGKMLWNTRQGQIPTVICPNGYSIDGYNCYKNSYCPANTTLQADGKCKMQYDWYSYHCPTDTNIYTNPWIVRNPGKDCGNPTCTNSSTPPSNNCVRVNYTCPLDSNQMCGKTVNNNVDCGTGYIYKDYRCVREEPYCGEYTYNAAKDICENIQQNNKKCLNSNETYDLELNKCVSQNPVCLNGSKWNDTTGVCEDDFEVACKQEGYVFNKTSGLCENKSIPICPEQYRYDTTLSACVGEMTFCAPDEVLNEETKMCEKNLCGSYSTINSNGRCETSALCNGTLTASGTCIPSNIIK